MGGGTIGDDWGENFNSPPAPGCAVVIHDLVDFPRLLFNKHSSRAIWQIGRESSIPMILCLDFKSDRMYPVVQQRVGKINEIRPDSHLSKTLLWKLTWLSTAAGRLSQSLSREKDVKPHQARLYLTSVNEAERGRENLMVLTLLLDNISPRDSQRQHSPRILFFKLKRSCP